MGRTPCCDKSGLKKGTWTPEEDRKLMAYVTKYGCWNWRQLPKYAGLSRCGKSCRLRWMNYLRPNIKRGNYTKEEEDTIIRLHESLGNRWSAIAAQLSGRTDNEIKNHWHTNLKKREKRNSSDLSLHKKCKEERNKPKIDLINPSTPQAMESSTMSSKQYTSDISSTTTDNINIAETSSIELKSDDDEFAFLEAYEAPTENFWKEPFLTDNYYMPPLLDPLSPFLDNEMLFSNGLCEQYGGILDW